MPGHYSSMTSEGNMLKADMLAAPCALKTLTLRLCSQIHICTGMDTDSVSLRPAKSQINKH